MFSNLTCITLKTRFEIDVVAQTISNLVSITVDPIHDLQSLSYNKNQKKKKNRENTCQVWIRSLKLNEVEHHPLDAYDLKTDLESRVWKLKIDIFIISNKIRLEN